MGLNTYERKNVDYFIGTEIEHTAMRGQRTLFIVGPKPPEEIKKIAKKLGFNHIYLGASQSFNPETPEDWKQWSDVITPLLKDDYWVTLDFDVKYADNFHEEGWCEYHNFIPMISVKLPYIKLFNYHATLKIDDKTWGATNTGVWCHSLHELQSKNSYIDWKDYHSDSPLDIQP